MTKQQCEIISPNILIGKVKIIQLSHFLFHDDNEDKRILLYDKLHPVQPDDLNLPGNRTGGPAKTKALLKLFSQDSHFGRVKKDWYM